MSDVDHLQEWADIPRELAEIVVIEANKHGLTLKQLRSPSVEAHRYSARKKIALKARSRPTPFSFPQIGRAINRDHSTVISMLRGRR